MKKMTFSEALAQVRAETKAHRRDRDRQREAGTLLGPAPDYAAHLQALPKAERQRLVTGDWEAHHETG